MHFQQFYLGCLAHASYLIGDERTRTAVVVDPQRDVDQYIAEAERLGFTIRHVFLTHFHADFLAGHLELRDRVGATVHLSAQATAEFDFVPAGEGDRLEFGDVRLEFLDTPGHTNEAVSILVYDLARDADRPYAVLTGDTLFIGDVGRPDLLASVGMTADELGSLLYDSLHDKLLKLPDETLVYPAHGAGSLCGKQLSTEKVSTIGEQRAYNYALQPMSKDEFVALVTADQPEAPPYFLYDAGLNRKERATLDEALEHELKPLDLETVLSKQGAGAQVLDVREPAAFAGGHLAGSLQITLAGRFATWAGFLVDRERPVVLIAEPGREHEAALRLGRIGYDIVDGYLERGLLALEDRPDLVERVERVSARALDERRTADGGPVVLDVRTEQEWAEGHLEGSLNIPLQDLSRRLGELPRDATIALMCQTGQRSSSAASLLLLDGIQDIRDVVGGVDAWTASGLPLSGSVADPSAR